MFGGNFAPKGWAQCDGQLLSIDQNQSLYSLLGTMYGGDGRTTFALPDLRGRVPISFGTLAAFGNNFEQGAKGGQETVQLTSQQMPSHTHIASARVHGDFEFNCGNAAGTSTDPENNFLGSAGTENLYSAPIASGVLMAPKAFELEAQIQVDDAGGGQEHSNMAPFQVVNFIIALQGIYPSRN